MRALAVLLLVVAGCARPAPKDVLDLPLHPDADHPDAGVVDGGAGATCGPGDGCDPTCPFLDNDCPDGAVCQRDGLCGSGCFTADPDCSPSDDGLPCVFGEECKSQRCTFVDDGSLCTRPCTNGECESGFACEHVPDKDEALCLPSSCGASGCAIWAILGAVFARRNRRILARTGGSRVGN